ncbi:MAG: MFS transporter, partial [Archaeoglobi archaeon]|nr:MFS transporter [Candidatus Mnemosynella sp.]
MKEESLVLTLFAGISSVAVSMILPYIPLFAQESGLSLELIGYVVFTYYIVQVIMRIPIGSLSDALGDDRIILMGAVSMLLSPLFYLLSLRV